MEMIDKQQVLNLPRRKGYAVNGWDEYIRVSDIEQLPSVQPRVGKWERGRCSECHEFRPRVYDFNFCPNCGASMKAGDVE